MQQASARNSINSIEVVNALNELQGGISELRSQFQEEQAARQQLTSQSQDWKMLDALVAENKVAIENLSATLQQENLENSYKNVEMIAKRGSGLHEQVMLEVSTLHKDLKFQMGCSRVDGVGDTGGVEFTAFEQLKADLDEEIRLRCYNDAQIVARISRQLSEVRAWSVKELKHLQASWEQSEENRHQIQKQEWLEHCRKMQSHVDAVTSYMFSS